MKTIYVVVGYLRYEGITDLFQAFETKEEALTFVHYLKGLLKEGIIEYDNKFLTFKYEVLEVAM